MKILAIVLLSSAVFGISSIETRKVEVFMCTCQEKLTSATAEQYTFLVRGESGVACKQEKALKSFPGYREVRKANEGSTWTVEGRTAMRGRAAQRAGLRLKGVEVQAVQLSKFPAMVKAYYPDIK